MGATRSSDDDLISIGRLAADSGVSSRTIRYYEELGILPEPPRTAGGTRKYPRDYRFYVEGALALKEVGFTLDEIKHLGRMALGRPMSDRQREEATEMVTDRMRALEHKIRVLNRLREILNEQGQVTIAGELAHLADLLENGESDSTSTSARLRSVPDPGND